MMYFLVGGVQTRASIAIGRSVQCNLRHLVTKRVDDGDASRSRNNPCLSTQVAQHLFRRQRGGDPVQWTE